jgi:hypothetical protein
LKEISETNLIHTISKNAKEQVRVEFMNYRGQDVLNLWVYYNAGDTKEDWLPSKKGLSLSTDHIPELKEAVDKASQVWEEQSESLPGNRQ